MRVLILGGTGFIGRHVVRALAGHDVWVLHRGRTGGALTGARHLQGDRDQLAVRRGELSRLQPDVTLDMIPRNGDDAQQVIDGLRGCTGRLVAISSVSVYRSFGVLLGTEPDEVDNRPCDEDAPLRRRLFPYRGAQPRAPEDPRRWLDDYDKIPAERAYLGAEPGRAAVVRLPMVFGPEDPDRRLAGYLRRMLDGRPVLLHERAAAWRNSRSFVANVGHAIARVVLEGEPGCIYNVAEPEDLDEAAWIEAIGRQIAWRSRVRIVPHAWSWRARPALDELPRGADFSQHLRLDASRIRRALGHVDPVELQEGLHRTVTGALASVPGAVDYREDDRLLEALGRNQPPPWDTRVP